MKVDFRLHTSSAVKNCAAAKKVQAQETIPKTSMNNTGMFLSFTANPLKNTSQVASIAPEYQGILNSVYKLGGLGNVAGEASLAFSDSGKMDFRTFVPYYAPENTSGGIKVKTPLIEEGKPVIWDVPRVANGTPIMQDGKPVIDKVPAYEFKSVPMDYALQEGENFVIHEPVNKFAPWKTGYKILEETGITGSVESVNDDLSGMKKTSYKVFSIQGTGINKAGSPPVYIVHTPQLAKFPRAYGGVSAYAGGSFEDADYAVFSKASVDAMPKLNKEEFGNFNPANYWLHDRQAFPTLVEISEKSSQGDEYWRGIKVHSSFHNPGRDYQGHYTSPIDFMRIIGSNEDLKEIQKNPDDYKFIRDMISKLENERKQKNGKFSPEEILSKEELARLNEIFEPLYGDFKDETGQYNLCKIPIDGVRKNPFNFSAGTVSTTFGKEMKNHNTKEIAPGLTKDLASIPTVDIVNGSSAKSMRLDITGDFGRNNGFTEEVKKGFTPLTKEITESPDLLFEAKQSNKKWLIDTFASHGQNQDTLASLVYSRDAIEKGSTVLGGLSEYKDKDVLFVSWGRPDAQKGFPTTLEGVLDYFKDAAVPQDKKEHAKFLIGAGPWGDEARDWKTIKSQMKQIEELDGGKYKGNVCYLNGFFTNRIVACADYANITSRYEPCGITPLESFAGGTPVISNRTGGSPDFIAPFVKGKEITNETGFLTKNAYLVNPEVIGAEPTLKGLKLDAARRAALGKENASCIEEAVTLLQDNPSGYKKMMMNAINAKIDWHENGLFNGGKSAIERYKECAWAIGGDNKVLAGQERNIEPLATLKGRIFKKNPVVAVVETKVEEVTEKIKEGVEKTGTFSSGLKKYFNSFLTKVKNHKALAVSAAVVVAGLGIFRLMSSKNKPDVSKLNPKFVKQTARASTLGKLSFDNFAKQRR